MLEPYRDFLNSLNIVLASGSPRRKEILEQLGLRFTCCQSDYDEQSLQAADFESKSAYVMALASKKVHHVKTLQTIPDLVIGADTIVVCEGDIYGKPHCAQKAAETLRILSGKTHEVYTGVLLDWRNNFQNRDYDSFFTRTLVKMAELSEADIEAYIKTGEPLDKAGAYGIQGLGGSMVEWVNGDFYNVMGFPLHDFCQVIRKKIENCTDSKLYQ